ncbi:hypothetical protein [Novosphingobium resinovorum]|uniref:hypothetical protein n=1 Tax=Novosphingobium resinovorum TaxID=158500 RepID=UPI002ED5B13B|nr:hypothetical protein [Novosphingobium resinovorum]
MQRQISVITFGVADVTALALDVASESAVDAAMPRLALARCTVPRSAASSPHHGRRGYVADSYGHAPEIAWNPAQTVDNAGHVTFGA